MIHPIWYGVGAYGLAEAYERLPPEIKHWVKRTFNTHHGTIGAGAVVGGAITGNIPLMTLGGGLMYHDRKDAPEWPKDIQRIVDLASNKVNQILDNLKQQHRDYQSNFLF